MTILNILKHLLLLYALAALSLTWSGLILKMMNTIYFSLPSSESYNIMSVTCQETKLAKT